MTARQCPSLTQSQDSVCQAVGGCLRSDGISSSPPASGVSSRAPLAETVSLSWSRATEGWEQQISFGQWFVSATNHWMSLGFLSSAVLIVTPAPTVELYTDISLQGWRGHVSLSVSDHWTYSKKLLHINRLVGASSRFSCPLVLCTLSEGQGSSPLHRQNNGCLLHQQGGGSSVHASLYLDRRNVTLLPDPGDFSLSQTHPRQTQHCS